MVITRASFDQRKWQEAFHGLLQFLKNQQTQIESLATERKFLKDRLKLQNNRWKSDVDSLTDQISQEKRKSAVQKMSRQVDSAKAELLQGMKQKEAFIYKTKLDRTLDDMSDFRSMYNNHLMTSKESSNNNDNSNNRENNKSRPPEILALLSERDFAWNQLKNKSSEIEKANLKIKKLESMNGDKDDLILNLKADLVKFDSIKKKKGEDVSSTSRPRTRSSSAAAAASRRKNIDSKVSQFPNMGGRSLKRSRKSVDISGDSKLFKSTFKVPKLKASVVS